jgi:uncharacterized protein YbjT (DUF2867 family)
MPLQPTLFMENPHYLLFVKEGIEKHNVWRTPLTGRSNPIAAYDVARVTAKVLLNPAPYFGKSVRIVGRALQTPEEVC